MKKTFIFGTLVLSPFLAIIAVTAGQQCAAYRQTVAEALTANVAEAKTVVPRARRELVPEPRDFQDVHSRTTALTAQKPLACLGARQCIVVAPVVITK